MAELVDAADSKSVFERSGSSILPRGTKIEKDLEIQGLFFRLRFLVLCVLRDRAKIENAVRTPVIRLEQGHQLTARQREQTRTER